MECAAPYVLLQRGNSRFGSMVAELPEDEQDALVEVAKKASMSKTAAV